MPWRDETSAQDCGCNGAAVPEGRHNLRAVPDWYTGGRASYRTVAQRPRVVPDFPDFLNSYRGGAVCRREATRSGGERVPPRTCVRGLLPRAAQAIACAAVLDLPCALPRVLPRASGRVYAGRAVLWHACCEPGLLRDRACRGSWSVLPLQTARCEAAAQRRLAGIERDTAFFPAKRQAVWTETHRVSHWTGSRRNLSALCAVLEQSGSVCRPEPGTATPHACQHALPGRACRDACGEKDVRATPVSPVSSCSGTQPGCAFQKGFRPV